jgi:LacI family transcriptional regulator
LLSNRKPFTALVTAHDNLTAGCLGVLAENGIVVPHDISLAGYGDTTYAAIMTPSLTSIHVPYYDGGVEAARLLINRIENPTDEVRQIRISPRLIARKSTAPPPALV